MSELPTTSDEAMDALNKGRADLVIAAFHKQVAALEAAHEALEIIAKRRQCLDNLMGDVDVARAALALMEKDGD